MRRSNISDFEFKQESKWEEALYRDLDQTLPEVDLSDIF